MNFDQVCSLAEVRLERLAHKILSRYVRPVLGTEGYDILVTGTAILAGATATPITINLRDGHGVIIVAIGWTVTAGAGVAHTRLHVGNAPVMGYGDFIGSISPSGIDWSHLTPVWVPARPGETITLSTAESSGLAPLTMNHRLVARIMPAHFYAGAGGEP